MYRAFTAWYARLLSWLLALTVAVLIIPVSLQIFSRYTQLIPAYIWTEEMARFLFIWMVMIGAMIGVREGSHFEVDVWPTLGAKGNAALQLASGIFVLVFAIVLLVLRVPVAFAVGLACVPMMLFEERLSVQNLVQETFNAYNSCSRLAV